MTDITTCIHVYN